MLAPQFSQMCWLRTVTGGGGDLSGCPQGPSCVPANCAGSAHAVTRPPSLLANSLTVWSQHRWVTLRSSLCERSEWRAADVLRT